MRQRSASEQDDSLNEPFGNDQSGPFTSNATASHSRLLARQNGLRLSLPQRALVIDEAPPEEWMEETPHCSKPISPADFQLIPRTSPALPSVRIKQSWFHKSSPRVTIIKLALIGLVAFSVLGATFATAGGGSVTNLLFSALQSVVPYSPATQPDNTTVAERVRPILQADINAGYDSREQHDIWWNSSCSAAATAEILHAWGIKTVTIGQLIDIMSAHNPPYITPWGGLMSQEAWPYMMSNFHMKAVVHNNRSMSYADIVQMTEQKGIPVVIGVRDSSGMYYPAFSVGHFLVAVGGTSAGLNIVDSSLYRVSYLSYEQMDYLWTGLTVVITPE